LNLTYLNLFLALVLIIVGGAGPQYPGHSGTTNNPVSNWVRTSHAPGRNCVAFVSISTKNLSVRLDGEVALPKYFGGRDKLQPKSPDISADLESRTPP